MPVGRLVLGRITKVDQNPAGEKRFHFSTRESLVVYGVGVVDRSKLEVGAQVESIVMAVADGKAFSQIKGSYIKIKVKGQTDADNLKVGDHVVSSLKKVTKEKISSEFIGRAGGKKGPEMSEGERAAQSIRQSVNEEAQRELEGVKALATEHGAAPADFDASLI